MDYRNNRVQNYDSRVLEKYEHINHTQSRQKVVNNCIHRLYSKRPLCLHLAGCTYVTRRLSVIEDQDEEENHGYDTNAIVSLESQHSKELLSFFDNHDEQSDDAFHGNHLERKLSSKSKKRILLGDIIDEYNDGTELQEEVKHKTTVDKDKNRCSQGSSDLKEMISSMDEPNTNVDIEGLSELFEHGDKVYDKTELQEEARPNMIDDKGTNGYSHGSSELEEMISSTDEPNTNINIEGSSELFEHDDKYNVGSELQKEVRHKTIVDKDTNGYSHGSSELEEMISSTDEPNINVDIEGSSELLEHDGNVYERNQEAEDIYPSSDIPLLKGLYRKNQYLRGTLELETNEDNEGGKDTKYDPNDKDSLYSTKCSFVDNKETKEIQNQRKDIEDDDELDGMESSSECHSAESNEGSEDIDNNSDDSEESEMSYSLEIIDQEYKEGIEYHDLCIEDVSGRKKKYDVAMEIYSTVYMKLFPIKEEAEESNEVEEDQSKDMNNFHREGYWEIICHDQCGQDNSLREGESFYVDTYDREIKGKESSELDNNALCKIISFVSADEEEYMEKQECGYNVTYLSEGQLPLTDDANKQYNHRRESAPFVLLGKKINSNEYLNDNMTRFKEINDSTETNQSMSQRCHWSKIKNTPDIEGNSLVFMQPGMITSTQTHSWMQRSVNDGRKISSTQSLIKKIINCFIILYTYLKKGYISMIRRISVNDTTTKKDTFRKDCTFRLPNLWSGHGF